METEHITVSSQGSGMQEALAMSERFGEESGLQHKENLRLQLLAEELFGMLKSIVGEVEADYWIEQEDRNYEIHLKTDAPLTQEMHKKLISVSSYGENAAAKGFMGKLRDMIGYMLLPDEDAPSMLSVSLMSMGSPGGYSAGSDTFSWSLSRYKSTVEESLEEDVHAKEAWDELENSIVANLADEVNISIVGTEVEIVLSKSFG